MSISTFPHDLPPGTALASHLSFPGPPHFSCPGLVHVHEHVQLLLPRSLNADCSLCLVYSCPRYPHGWNFFIFPLSSKCHLLRQAFPDCPLYPTSCSARCLALFYIVGIMLCTNLLARLVTYHPMDRELSVSRN